MRAAQLRYGTVECFCTYLYYSNVFVTLRPESYKCTKINI
jgi:hypothetical protein